LPNAIRPVEIPTADAIRIKDLGMAHKTFFNIKREAKTKTFSVPEGMLLEARSYIENYKLLKSKVKLLEEKSEKIIEIKSYRDELKKSR
jgi:hypothetical protein